VAADQIEGHGKWLRLREDAVLPLVEKFFADRIFGPMRLDKLQRQLRTHNRNRKRASVKSRTRIVKDLGDVDRRIAKQIQALEADVEPELVGRRIGELRAKKTKLEAALAELARVQKRHPSTRLDSTCRGCLTSQKSSRRRLSR
jgi:site-specific DNA recombinase